ncbi:hypothetical protein CXB51_021881 [Gossypium anomalum]|uniref:Reverse transcriptase domain-containing protein n=1 Tax=Gossypium anomalum TaxID=47600 RepID=A0A8J5YJ93_9ROSI|nr:hypothetical protein CXB51_021881 [Gossypium anomalum]
MKTIYWDVCGPRSLWVIRRLRAEDSKGGLCLEWKGDIVVNLRSISKNHIVVLVKLMDLGYSGPWFTLERGNLLETNIKERLDRGVTNDKWMSLFPNGRICHLPHSFSDHCPLLLNTDHRRTLHMNTISRLEHEDSNEFYDEEEIWGTATRYFQTLSLPDGIGDPSYILSGIEVSISLEINTILMDKYIDEEVYEAAKDIGPTKALRIDGFLTMFFWRCWHIVGSDVTKFRLSILNDGMDFDQANITDIVLLPKILNPINLANFRPLSLCMVIYKILAKVLANRLQCVIRNCIDNPQSAFVPEQLISDNVLFANEILYTYRQKRMGKKGYMALKLDMRKAYDRVEWGLLKVVMLRMGFDKG